MYDTGRISGGQIYRVISRVTMAKPLWLQYINPWNGGQNSSKDIVKKISCASTHDCNGGSAERLTSVVIPSEVICRLSHVTEEKWGSVLSNIPAGQNLIRLVDHGKYPGAST